MSAFSTSNFPFVFRVVDLIPQSDSAESDQNSEPSIAVNPLNPMQMFAGLFGAGGGNPYFVSTDGGATWSIFGTVAHGDTTSAWKVDGSAVLVATMIPSPDFGPLDTRSVTVPGGSLGAPINHYVGSNLNDQPWLRTGASNHVYVAYNDLGKTIGHLEKFFSPSRCESDSLIAMGHGRMERASHGADGLFRC